VDSYRPDRYIDLEMELTRAREGIFSAILLIPAGVAHKLLEKTTGFLVVGAYPAGQSCDVCYGRPGERPLSDRRIEAVPLPVLDPVRGEYCPLLELWRVGSGGGN
jgi:uncharacterized protein YjlB